MILSLNLWKVLNKGGGGIFMQDAKIFNGDDFQDIRSGIYERMALRLAGDIESAYTFMKIVCYTAGITDLTLIEKTFKYSKNQIKERNNN